MKKKTCKNKGKGLFLKPYQGGGAKNKRRKTIKGKGLFLKPYQGRGVLNALIDTLPVPLHIPTYSYCGPGTKIRENLAKNVPPKNKLDSYCKEHDVFYMNNPNVSDRNKADMKLAAQAWSRVTANDASLAERAAAYAVTNLMKAKAKMGLGFKFNKKYEQLPVVRGRKKNTTLSRRVSKKPIKKAKTKKNRKRNN